MLSTPSGLNMDWSLCVICQGKDTDGLVYPSKGKRFNPHEVYNNFLKNVEQFKILKGLPCTLQFHDECSADTFIANNACWHKICHQQFNNEKLGRLKKKKQDESRVSELVSERRRSARLPSTRTEKDFCIFCMEVPGETYQLCHQVC